MLEKRLPEKLKVAVPNPIASPWKRKGANSLRRPGSLVHETARGETGLAESLTRRRFMITQDLLQHDNDNNVWLCFFNVLG